MLLDEVNKLCVSALEAKSVSTIAEITHMSGQHEGACSKRRADPLPLEFRVFLSLSHPEEPQAAVSTSRESLFQ